MLETYQDGAAVGLVVDKERGYLGQTCVLTIWKKKVCAPCHNGQWEGEVNGKEERRGNLGVLCS